MKKQSSEEQSLIPALLTGGLLLAGQACFAEDQWAGVEGAEFGPKAKAH
jgi:hypothetical protein